MSYPETLDTGEERALLELTCRLIRIPSSVNDGREIYHFVYEFLRSRGLPVFFQGIDNPYLEYQEYSNLYVKMGTAGARRSC